MAKNKILSDRLNTFFTDNKMTIGTSIPTSGTWAKGDIVISSIQENSECGWICVEAGTPGKWELFGAGGGGKFVSVNDTVTIDTATSEISLLGLNVNVNGVRDKLNVYLNSHHLMQGVDYDISSDGTKITKLGSGKWNDRNETGCTFSLELLKLVKNISGDKISVKTSLVQQRNVVVTPIATREVNIGIQGFRKDKDMLMVFKNSTFMVEGVDYEVSIDGTKITKKTTGNWNEANEATYSFAFVILKEVEVIKPDAVVGEGNIIDGSVTLIKLSNEVKVELGKVGDLAGLKTTDKSGIVNAINELVDNKLDENSLSDAVNNDSSTSAASSKAVKIAMDKAVEALNKANEISGSVGASVQTLVEESNKIVELWY